MLLPPWLAYSIQTFAALMLVAYLLTVWSAHMLRSDKSDALTLFAIVVVAAVLIGVLSARRTRMSILDSDENGYTVHIERGRKK